MIITALILFYIVSLPVVGRNLAAMIEIYPALSLDDKKIQQQQAIVVLGGGMHKSAPEYSGNPKVNNRTAARVRYAATITKKIHLPLMVSGGKVLTENLPSEAELMVDMLVNEYHVDVTWQDRQSRNTAENATFSRELLRRENIRNIILITDARHMHRAKDQFTKAGFKVLPAPISFISNDNKLTILDFLPSAMALSNNAGFLHEVLGKVWYSIRYN